jgi:hypothetical protein
MGTTWVLCTAAVEENVPSFLSGRGQGWVTSEYAMIPPSSPQRIPWNRGISGGRQQEIRRLIGRGLRAAIDLKRLGERQIMLDCTVLQADGGTRTASVTGAYVALALAIHDLLASGKLALSPLVAPIAAVSVGLVHGEALLDLAYVEDNRRRRRERGRKQWTVEVQAPPSATFHAQLDVCSIWPRWAAAPVQRRRRRWLGGARDPGAAVPQRFDDPDPDPIDPVSRYIQCFRGCDLPGHQHPGLASFHRPDRR